MISPNFSESQLQQVVNSAIASFTFHRCHNLPFPFIPSLVREYDLGWDTAFHIPFFAYASDPEQHGCNLFIQYKLSSQLSSRGAKEWAQWGEPFMRFKIPYKTRDKAGARVDDFHQWDRLKELASRGYGVFYATNTTMSREDLIVSYHCFQSLLKYVVFLDVAAVASRHESVTFTLSSDVFKLHSRVESSPLFRFDSLVSSVKLGKGASSIHDASQNLLNSLREMSSEDTLWQDELKRIDGVSRLFGADDLGDALVLGGLKSFIKKHLGAEMLWVPNFDFWNI
jgi:hypothetical protein